MIKKTPINGEKTSKIVIDKSSIVKFEILKDIFTKLIELLVETN